MKDRKLVSLYSRVSANGQDPKMQIRELREYCKRRGWQVYDEYVDRNVSGTKECRPQLDRLMADAHRRRFDLVCVWKFDRFARSVSHLLRALETFRSLGIGFSSVTEQIATDTPAGLALFTVLGAIGALERSLIAERVQAGLRNAKAEGKRLGRPPLRDLTKEDIRLLRRERRKGLSFKELARNHGISVWTAFEKCRGVRH